MSFLKTLSPTETPSKKPGDVTLRQDLNRSSRDRSSNDYQMDTSLRNSQTVVVRESRTGSQLKPGDPDFKEDLSLSRSFQQYEVMDATIRTSRSSLLAIVERAESEGNAEGEEKEEKEGVNSPGEVGDDDTDG